MNNLIIKIKKHFSKKSVKSKIGATLIELVAVVCILAITSTTCISGMFAMADIAKRGQDLSFCERTSDNFAKVLSLYAHSGSDVEGYSSKPPMDITKFQNSEKGLGNNIDYFLYADPNVNYRVILAKFTVSDGNTTPDLETFLTFDNVKSITFNLKKLSSKGNKYVLQYTLTTVGTNVWDKSTDKRVTYEVSSGVVLNNTDSTTTISLGSDNTITTKSPNNNANGTHIRIRSVSRSEIDIS